MDQELDIQIAALIFLAGTQSLGSDHAEEADEILTDITDDESDEVNPATVNEIISFSTNNSYFLSNCQVNIPTSS